MSYAPISSKLYLPIVNVAVRERITKTPLHIIQRYKPDHKEIERLEKDII